MKPRSFPLRVVIVALAALFGFTCIATFHSSPDLDSYSEHSILGRAISSVRSVKWMSYSGKYQAGLSPMYSDIRNKTEDDLLATLPKGFQERLTSGLPIDCHLGPHDLIKERHARFLRTLLDYADYHNQFRNSRSLTWQCSVYDHCGGLGDRIRGVAYALLLAIFSRRRLVIFWEDPTEGQYLHPHMINWRDEKILEFLRNKKGSDRSSLSDPHLFSFHVVMDEAGKIANDVSKEDMQYYQRIIASNETNVIISTNLELSSLLAPKRNGDQEWIRAGLRWSGLLHFSPIQLDNIVGLIFRYLFTIDERVVKEMILAMETLDLSMVQYGALHLRTGFAGMEAQFQELVRHPKLEHNVSKWHSALQCAQDMADEHIQPGSPVFLATDSNLVKNIAVSKFGPRIRTLRNNLLHVDKLPKRPHRPNSTEIEGVLVVWVEFLLLAQAKVLVRGESGYSWTAGLLCGLHRNRTVSIEDCKHNVGSVESKHWSS